jgi:Sec-independent protein translocase protein TatA
MSKYLLAALAVLVVAAGMLAMHFRGALAVSRDLQHQAQSRAAQLDADLKASEKARADEHAKAEQFQAIAQQYEQDKNDAQGRADKLAADLRAERVRLRPEWRCDVPQAPIRSGKPDAAADDRAASAARVVRAAADADDQIRALQAILKVERQ